MERSYIRFNVIRVKRNTGIGFYRIKEFRHTTALKCNKCDCGTCRYTDCKNVSCSDCNGKDIIVGCKNHTLIERRGIEELNNYNL